MSKFRRILNTIRGIHPHAINNERSVKHEFEHDGHRVSVYHLQDRPEDPRSFSTHFQVDGDFNKGKKMNPKTGVQILSKINNHVDAFIRTHKPSEMRLSGTSSMHGMYGIMAKRLAAKHEAEVSLGDKTHTIRFK